MNPSDSLEEPVFAQLASPLLAGLHQLDVVDRGLRSDVIYFGSSWRSVNHTSGTDHDTIISERSNRRRLTRMVQDRRFDVQAGGDHSAGRLVGPDAVTVDRQLTVHCDEFLQIDVERDLGQDFLRQLADAKHVFVVLLMFDVSHQIVQFATAAIVQVPRAFLELGAVLPLQHVPQQAAEFGVT